MATGFVKHFRQAGALCLSGKPLCQLGIPLCLLGSQVSQGTLFIFCTAKGSGTPSVPLWAGFDALWAGLFSGERAIAWKLISL